MCDDYFITMLLLDDVKDDDNEDNHNNKHYSKHGNRPDFWFASTWVESGPCVCLHDSKQIELFRLWIHTIGIMETQWCSWGTHSSSCRGTGLCKWSHYAQLREEHSPSWSLPESAGDLLRRMGPGLLAELFWGVGDAFGPAVAEGFPFMTRHSDGKRHRQLTGARGGPRLSILTTSGS